MDTEPVTQLDALAVALHGPPRTKARSHLPIYLAAGAYAVLVAATIHRHEPWADEAQAWLLGRDATLAHLWGRLLHYEGQPGLWQTLVHALVHLGLPYAAYSFVSGVLAFCGVALLLRYAPLPLFIRVLLPFTYYLCYQYAVIARSYVLIAPLLFAIALIFTQALQKPILMTALLCLLAGVSVHGLLISACIWVALYAPLIFRWTRITASDRRKLLIAGGVYGLVMLLLVACAWPAQNVGFAEHRGFSNLHLFWDFAKAYFGGAFTGDWRASLALIALSLPFLWRGRGLLFFLLASAALCLFGTLVYTQVWHFGILFLAWLFAIWISAYNTRITILTQLALIAAIGVQCYWTAAAIRYDWGAPYSGSQAAARYLLQQGVPSGGLYAIGYSSTALQPYFPSNIYSDFHDSNLHGDTARPAYWDWSKANTANDPNALFASCRRELVLVGYKAVFEKKQWGDLLALLGYEQTRHFEGNLFWQTGTLESESFDLYRKGSGATNAQATSSVNAGDPARAAQLLKGFYNIEANAWRWSAKNFSVLLKAPPGSEKNGCELALHFYIPDAQVQKSGAMTLSAEIDGHELPARTFSQTNAYTYSAHVPAELLQSGFVAVNFRLDKAAIGLNGDSRELGVVVTSISLDPAR
jgi:hypothetical protein